MLSFESIALELGHTYIGSEHILYGLSAEGTGVAGIVLENQGVTKEAVLKEIEELIGKEERKEDEVGTIGFTPRTKRIIENAFLEARKLGMEYIGTEHLLVGIMREGDSVAVRIMMDLQVNPQKLYGEFVKVLNDEEIDSMINNTDKLINEGIDKILEGDFTINPKVIDGTNVSCSFCEYKDICYLREKDITYINREEDKDGEEV